MRKGKEVLIEKIYDRVYADSVKTVVDDQALSKEIEVILEGADLDSLDQDKLGMMLCKAILAGQRQGFIRGFHFVFQMIAEAVL